MHETTLTGAEIDAVRGVVGELTSRFDDVEDPEFQRILPLAAHELPRRLRAFLNDFRTAEPSGVCLVSGFPVDQERIGRTPEHWRKGPGVSPALPEEVFFALCGSLLGDLFGWSTQQDGRIMHDLMPIKGHEGEQLGSGSEQLLWWHTEDAFHPFKGDYVALMCLRNPDGVETTVASTDNITWPREGLEPLFGPNYHIRPDESHLPKNRGEHGPRDETTARLLRQAYERIVDMNENPVRRPVLFGDRTDPYMSLDPYFMDVDQMPPAERESFDLLVEAIESAMGVVVLQPGDCCFIDNLRTVHGRNPFRARYDGNDRWLKRLNITRNLRISREARRSNTDRVIF